VNILSKGFSEHLRAGISTLLVFSALFLCGCGASTPEPTQAEKPDVESAKIAKEAITEPEYLKRARGIVVEILGEASRAAVSCEAVQRAIEKEAKANPESLQNVQQWHLYQFAIKTMYVTNFQHLFVVRALNSFVRESPPRMSVVSNEMSRVVSEFLGLRDIYLADGFDNEWRTNVTKQAGIVYSALSSAITSLNLATNLPGASEECFRTSYRSPYQRRPTGITPTGREPDNRMIVEHLLRFDWTTYSFHQQLSIDPVERAGNFQLIGPYVVVPLPTVLTNRTVNRAQKGEFIYTNSVYTNLAVVIFRRETNSVLKTLFSDVRGLKDAEFKVGDCSLEVKPQ
jgi:hypothetical protein